MDTNLDPQAYNLARAIKRAETGGYKDPYNTSGGNGQSFGAYQFLKPTWQEWAKQYLGDANAPLTVANQNKVAYSRIKDLKDQGFSPAQIASSWNAGGPNKYKTQGPGYNEKEGRAHDVAAYTRKVSAYYNELKSQMPPQQQQAPATPQGPQNPAFLERNGREMNRIVQGPQAFQEGSWLNKTTTRSGREVVGGSKGFLPEVVQTIGKAARTATEGIDKVDTALRNPNIQGPSKFLQVVGNTVGTVGNVAGDVIVGFLGALAPEGIDRAVTRGVEGVGQHVANNATVQRLMGDYQEFKQRDPEAAANLEATLSGIGGAIDIATLGAGSAATAAPKKAIQAAIKSSIERTLKTAGRETVEGIAKKSFSPVLAEAAKQSQWEALGSFQKTLIRKGLAGEDTAKHFLPQIEKATLERAIDGPARILSKAFNNGITGDKARNALDNFGEQFIPDYVPGQDYDKVIREVLKRTDLMDSTMVGADGKTQLAKLALNAENTAGQKLKALTSAIESSGEAVQADKIPQIIDDVVSQMTTSGAKFNELGPSIRKNVQDTILNDLKGFGLKVSKDGKILPGQRVKLKDALSKYFNYDSSDVTKEAIKKTYRKLASSSSNSNKAKAIDDAIKDFQFMKDAAKVYQSLNGKKLSKMGMERTIGLIAGIAASGGGGFGIIPTLKFIGGSAVGRGIFRRYNVMRARSTLAGDALKNHFKKLNELWDDSLKAIQDEDSAFAKSAQGATRRKSSILKRREAAMAKEAAGKTEAGRAALAEANDLASLEASEGIPLDQIPEELIQRELQQAEDSLSSLRGVKAILKRDARFNSDAKKELLDLAEDEALAKEQIRTFRSLIKNRGVVDNGQSPNLTPEDMNALQQSSEGIQY